MPSRVSPSDRRLFLAAGAVLIALIAVSALLTGSAGNAAEVPSTYSTGSSGAQAAYLLLEAAGHRVERWEEALPGLPGGAGVTLVLAEPASAPDTEDRLAIRRFLDQGGIVIATGMSGSLFLPERRVASDPLAGLTWTRVSARSPSPITRAAPQITMAPLASWTPDSFGLPLYRD